MANLASWNRNWLDAAAAMLRTGSGFPRDRERRSLESIRREQDKLSGITDRELAHRTSQLGNLVKSRASRGVANDVLFPGLALCVEAARRTLGINLYDVQILAGLALARGRVAEMQTGEGKTFTAALPAFVHALAGKGAHVMTVNDYLAQRDWELMGPVFKLLGMSVGFLRARDSHAAKRQAYQCDITYGPSYEYGFDYLRDQAALLAVKKPALGQRFRERLSGRGTADTDLMQRGLAFCVIDEVDSVLIDEAATPLLLSGCGGKDPELAKAYAIADEVAGQLAAGQDYVLDELTRKAVLTKAGISRVSASGRIAARHGLLRPWTLYVRQALQARLLMARDVDYVVSEGKVMLVDQNTGRIAPDRSWRDGLHQAIETKEGLPPTAEQQPLGHITRQRFFQLYSGLCGMTGTATGNENELKYFYGLPVTVIPPRKPNDRIQYPTRYFADCAAKYSAITRDIVRLQKTGQPVLVGTRTIEVSEMLAKRLEETGTRFQLLNGKQDEEEAHIVGRAGERGAVTIATNMAGRGTDIQPGDGVLELGGLHIIATEHHESARVDRQLIGRTARQGQRGSCQFFVSADDALFRNHAQGLSDRIRLAAANGETQQDFSRELAALQKKLEALGFTQRQQMFLHDRWLQGVLESLAS